MKTIATDRYFIVSDHGLRQACAEWQQFASLGIDTEFIRVDTFHPRPALIQVSDGQRCWLVDVLQITDFAPLAEIMRSPSITKVVHAAGEDLEVFDHLLGTLPEPLFDTQIAAAFCGHGPSIGYSRLVQDMLGIGLSKDQCRSDWLARPLSDEQQLYASLDVLYLPALHSQLQVALQQRQRMAWAEEENARQLARYREQRDAAYNIERITNAWRLDEAARKRLWHLVLGRDALARQYNKPRNHIARDFNLLDMARRPPKHPAELSALDGMRPSAIRQFGHQLIQLVQTVPHELQCPPLFEPLGRQESELVKQLRQVVEDVATTRDIPNELLARKLELETLVRQYCLNRDPSAIILPARYIGWRMPVIGQPLQACMQRWG